MDANTHRFADRFAPYDDRTQPAMQVEGYKETLVRVPRQAFYRRPITLSEITGPLNLSRKLDANLSDMSRTKEGARALGQLIWVTGRLLDEDGLPMVEFPQSLERMTPAVMGAHQSIVAGMLTHDDDPVFAAHIYNAVPNYTERGFTLAKRKSKAKIDAAVAMCMAHSIGVSSDDRQLDLSTLFH